MDKLKNFQVIWEQEDQIAHVILNNPKKMNSMDHSFFQELIQIFQYLEKSQTLRCVIVRANGKHFTAGLDLKAAASLLISSNEDDSTAKQSAQLYPLIHEWQKAFQLIHTCKVPVISCIQGNCIGGGCDLILASDIRLATKDAQFSIRETKIAIVADLGTLQRIVKLTGNIGFAKEMAYTGNDYSASQWLQHGLLNATFDTQEELLAKAQQMAKQICSNSPLVVMGTKKVLHYSMEHSITEGLEYVSLWNSAFLKSEDLTEAIQGFMTKQTPHFKNRL